jgi:hypothetical protein
MAWIPLTVDSFRDRLGNDELDRLVEESPTPDAKLAEILAQVAAEFVSRINAGRRKRGLGPLVNTGLFIPPGSQRHAYAIARRLLTDAFPSLSEFNGEDRKLSVEAAENFLDDLANNNADADDTGASSFATASGASFRYSGKALMDFAESP